MQLQGALQEDSEKRKEGTKRQTKNFLHLQLIVVPHLTVSPEQAELHTAHMTMARECMRGMLAARLAAGPWSVGGARVFVRVSPAAHSHQHPVRSPDARVDPQ